MLRGSNAAAHRELASLTPAFDYGTTNTATERAGTVNAPVAP